MKYRGVEVPEDLAPNWDQPEAYWFRMGVDLALATPGSWAGPGFTTRNSESTS